MDSNTPYWPETLPLPLREGTKKTASGRAIRTIMESRRVRIRQTATSPVKTLDVVWAFTNDQFSAFESFFETTLENGTLAFMLEIFGVETEVLFMGEEGYSFSRSDNLFSVSATLEVFELPPEWDYTLCVVLDLDGVAGGDTFDCYPVGSYPDLLVQEGYQNLTFKGGQGFETNGYWIVEDAITFYGRGDTFEDYPVTTAGIMDEGTGFVIGNKWEHSDSIYQQPVGDSFDTYAVAAAGVMGDGTGFTGGWEHSDG